MHGAAAYVFGRSAPVLLNNAVYKEGAHVHHLSSFFI